MAEQSKWYVERTWTTRAGLTAHCVHGPWNRCGYVGVPVGHPLHGVDYNATTPHLPTECDEPIGKRGLLSCLTSRGLNSPVMAFDVHGSLTHSGPIGCIPGDDWLFGFDCGHAGDGRWGSMAEYSDGPVRTEEYVVSECESLAEQIVAKTLSPCTPEVRS